MSQYSNLKSAITAVIKENGNNEITGNLLQQTLLAMVNSLGANYQFRGIATPATDPGTPDQNVFYFATEAGIYSNFGGTSLTGQSIIIIYWDGAWHFVELTYQSPFQFGTASESAVQRNSGSQAVAQFAFASGQSTQARGEASHAEGYNAQATGEAAHAEGNDTRATGSASHAEGYNTQATGAESHAEGNEAQATGMASHAEGSATHANGNNSHAEGINTAATLNAHSEGSNTKAVGNSSHAEGYYTITRNLGEHASGTYNVSHLSSGGTFGNPGNTSFSHGVGDSEATRKNAFEIMGNGDYYMLGVGGYDGTNPDSAISINRLLKPVFLFYDVDGGNPYVELSTSEGFSAEPDFFNFLRSGGKALVSYHNTDANIIEYDWDSYTVTFYCLGEIITLPLNIVDNE